MKEVEKKKLVTNLFFAIIGVIIFFGAGTITELVVFIPLILIAISLMGIGLYQLLDYARVENERRGGHE